MNESSPRKEFALASRWLRLWGALIDSAIAILIGIPLVMWTGVWDLTLAGAPIPLALALKTALLSWTLIVALHGYLLYRYGQTIGKHCVDTAIVKTNGDPIDVKTIALRYLPVWTVSSIPMIGGLLSLVDVLFIARDDKRCVHDLIAGTKVVNVEDVPQAAEEAGASAA